VELRGVEPRTSCMPSAGSTSTSVHHRRSPSLDVHPDPPASPRVAVLSCCTPPPWADRRTCFADAHPRPLPCLRFPPMADDHDAMVEVTGPSSAALSPHPAARVAADLDQGEVPKPTAAYPGLERVPPVFPADPHRHLQSCQSAATAATARRRRSPRQVYDTRQSTRRIHAPSLQLPGVS
jgi:hypothetical protein